MPDSWQADNGYSTNAVYGFAMFLLQVLERENPKYCALAFDESLDSCFRNKIYPDYKSSRAHPDEELAFQLKSCKTLAKKMGFNTFASKKYEADDIIASLAKKFSTKSRDLKIVTRDKDLGQILTHDNDCLWDYAADEYSYAKQIKEKFGVKPSQIADYLALVGDSIDDIPGVPGVGKKTAQSLLESFESVEVLLDNLEKVSSLKMRGAQKVAEQLREYSKQCLMAKRLATLEYNVPLKPKGQKMKGQDLKLSDLTIAAPNTMRQVSSLKNYLRSLGFGERTLKRFATVYGWEQE